MASDEQPVIRIGGGVSSWRQAPTLTISEGDWHQDLIEVQNVEMVVDKSHGSTFRIESKHPRLKDLDSDPIRVFYCEGAGLQFDSIAGPRVRFTGVVTTVKYYPEDITEGPEGHRYHPPTQTFKPRLVVLQFDYYDRKKGKKK